MDAVKKLIAVEMMVVIVAVSAFIGENLPAGTPQIRVGGEVYTGIYGTVYSIPEGSEGIGVLDGVTHHTDYQPAEDMWGTNLDAKYAGCPLYRDAGNGDVIYLYDYAGYYLCFVHQGG